MIAGLRNIGDENVKFARWFLQSEGIRCVGESVGGNRGRKIRYWPHTGQAQQQLIDALDGAETAVAPRPAPEPSRAAGSLTLF